MADLTDKTLLDAVRKASAGDRESFRLLYEAYVQRIFNFVFGMTRSREDAEDITQSTFVQGFSHLSRLKDPEKFEFWIYRIARNEVYQRFRRKRHEEIPLEEAGDTEIIPADPDCGEGETPEDGLLREELEGIIDQALRTLPPKLKEVFILAVIQEKSYKEIADIVGRSLLSVKTDIYRARIFAKDAIRQYLVKG